MNSDDLQVCPFEISHRVRRSKYAAHVFRCQKNNPTVPIKTCPHNACHIVKAHLFDEHLRKCPDKIYEEREMLYSLASSRNEQNQIQSSFDTADEGTDWGQSTQSSNEASNSREKNMFYRKVARNPPNGLSRRRREAFRSADHQRMQRLDNNECILDIQYPDSADGFVTIAELINVVPVEVHSEKRATSFEVQKSKNLMSTGEPLKRTFLPSNVIQSELQSEVEGSKFGRKEDSTNDRQKADQFRKPDTQPRGFGRGSKMSEERKVGGLQNVRPRGS